MKPYRVKEMFLSVQGEGPHTGRPVLFVRMSGCNLWTGREEDRSKGKGACALFCDTDFLGTDGALGGVYSSSSLIDAIDAALDGRLWPVVFTGGEPLLQLDLAFINELKGAGFSCHVETNGTVRPMHMEGTLLDHFDCVVMSPKAGPRIISLSPHDVSAVKVVLAPEHDDAFLSQYERWKKINDKIVLYLQPVDPLTGGPNFTEVIQKVLGQGDAWRISLQTHKLLGLQ